MAAGVNPATIRFARLALTHALNGDPAGVQLVLERLSADCGGQGIADALRAWIDVYIDHATDGRMAMTADRILPVNRATGSLSGEGMPPEVAWSIRLIQARMQLDHDAWCACLEEIPDGPGEAGRHVVAVLQGVAMTMNGLPRGYGLMGRGVLPRE